MIGHEIAHSFDILARKELDHDYENVTWFWPEELSTKYEMMTKCFADQFSSFMIARIGENVRNFKGKKSQLDCNDTLFSS